MAINFANIKSCFLGLAIGDGLGVPVEFRDRSFLKDFPVKEMLGYGSWNQPPGTWSDDSSLTFCLAESLVNGYSLHDIGKKFVAWYKEGYWGAHHKLFDIGGTTRASIERISAGENPLFSGEPDESSNGNGALMRITPAALYFYNVSDDDGVECQECHEFICGGNECPIRDYHRIRSRDVLLCGNCFEQCHETVDRNL